MALGSSHPIGIRSIWPIVRKIKNLKLKSIVTHFTTWYPGDDRDMQCVPSTGSHFLRRATKFRAIQFRLSICG